MSNQVTQVSNTQAQVNHLVGKVAFVQGGSRGIGAAIAKRLARDGAAVALTYASSPDKAQEVVNEITAAGGRAIAIKADSADAAQLKAAINQAADTYGKIDILVNNAGVLALGNVADAEFSLEDIDRTLAVNVRSVIVASQAVVKHMDKGGRIITIGSTNSDRMPFQGGSIYAMSKAAIVGLTKGLARDLGPLGITVNNIQPGPIDTEMNPANSDFAESLLGLMASGRYGTVEEVASFASYLAGPEAAYITGASLLIDGGFAA
ncbi:MAG TPA: 3-oxoacyl-ACP reductase family protein [Rhodocyclaceae bacterium]|nr:3-oxoacyl-ACP reductase family protein [Rhodocyclaceae bacterium]